LNVSEYVAFFIRRFWTPFVLASGLALFVLLCSLLGNEQLQVALTEMLIRLTIVVGISIFVGNSGVLSFGHIGFMCIGAYAAAWAACDPAWKGMMLTGLPAFLQQNQYPFPIAILGGALLASGVALLFGLTIMRLSGIAASIATFAFLVVINSIYGNWDSLTGGTSSLVCVPTVVGPWLAYGFAASSILSAAIVQISGLGLMLRASRDDAIAAQSSGIRIVLLRLAAFVISAFFVGLAGGLYAHFLGILTVEVFYLNLTFITIAMLVIGGSSTLTGAVVGVVLVTAVTEILRGGEAGILLNSSVLALPRGSQEIGLGIIMALVLVFKPAGLINGREIPFPFFRRSASGLARDIVRVSDHGECLQPIPSASPVQDQIRERG
jgi:branched-chain amino acid transport system permease protein